MKDKLVFADRTDVLAGLSSHSAPVSMSTADGILHSENAPIDERVAAVRQGASEHELPGGCGGVGGGWGN